MTEHRTTFGIKSGILWMLLAVVVFLMGIHPGFCEETSRTSEEVFSHDASSVSQPIPAEVNQEKADQDKEAEKTKSGYGKVQEFGGPSSVGAQLRTDDEIMRPVFKLEGLHRAFKPYWNFKSNLNQKYGFVFGGDYSALIQDANQSLGEDTAAGGVFRFFGQWTLLGRGSQNTGTLVYKVENRHRLGTEVPPKQLADKIGYAGLTDVLHSNIGWALTNLYWYQKFFDNHLGIVFGDVDITDYVDVYALVNAWTEFNNLAFTTSPTIAAPNQGLGAALRVGKKDFYFLGGIADANGDPTDPGDFFHSFFSTEEYFTHAEVGWVSSWEKRFTDNIHLTGWHADERKEAGTDEGYGVAFSASYLFQDRWLPFVRFGISNGGGGAPLERSVSVGVGHHLRGKSDMLGFGLNWGRPSKKTYGSGFTNQYTAEVYYRLQLFQYLTITPDIQLLIHPALNPKVDQIWVFGLRARLQF